MANAASAEDTSTVAATIETKTTAELQVFYDAAPIAHTAGVTSTGTTYPANVEP
jgi:hypothetical protein